MGETALPLHKRTNIYRKAKSDCEYMIKHFRNDCVESSFSIQILKIFEGDGYVNGTFCPITQEKGLGLKDHWMIRLGAKYLYGLNDGATIPHKTYEAGSRSFLRLLTKFSLWEEY